jgi:peptidoglycan/LPS O-acetylase OafA/YrhL
VNRLPGTGEGGAHAVETTVSGASIGERAALVLVGAAVLLLIGLLLVAVAQFAATTRRRTRSFVLAVWAVLAANVIAVTVTDDAMPRAVGLLTSVVLFAAVLVLARRVASRHHASPRSR